MPRRDKSHIIEEASERILRGILREESWLVRRQSLDYGVDLQLEYVEDEEPSGLTANVQLKGTRRLRRANGYIKQDLRTDHLKYYLDRVRMPVFIIVVDVKSATAWYLFVQKYLREIDEAQSWREKNKLRLNIPETNRLSNSDFNSEIENAENYMRIIRPGTIDSAIKYEKAKLESLDNRFLVNIAANSSGGREYSLSPRDPLASLGIQGTIQIESAAPKDVRDFAEFGKPAKFTKAALDIKGSDLIAKIIDNNATGELVIGTDPIAKLDLTIFPKSPGIGGNTRPLMLPALAYRGSKGVSVVADVTDCPLKFTLRLQGMRDKQVNVHGTMSFDAKAWEGHKLSALPYWSPLRSLGNAASTMGSLEVVVADRGNEVFSTSFSYKDSNGIREILYSIEVASAIGSLSQRFGINKEFEDVPPLGSEAMETLIRLATLSECGEFNHLRRGGPLTVRFKLKVTAEALEISRWADSPELINRQNPQTIEIFGQEVTFPESETRVAGLVLAPASLARLKRAKVGDWVDIELQGGKHARVIESLDSERISIRSD